MTHPFEFGTEEYKNSDTTTNEPMTISEDWLNKLRFIQSSDPQEIRKIVDREPAEHNKLEEDKPVNDAVNHPSHYTYGTIETIDYIEDKDQNFNLGNAVKYISRAGHKLDAIEDLKKAAWYVEREITRLQKEKNRD